MPGNIVEYNNPIDTLHPSEQGVQAAVQAGRRIGVFYHQMGEDVGGAVAEVGKQYQDEVTRQQVSHGLAAQSQLWASLTDSWNQTAKGADPNDPSVAAKWRTEQLEPALQAWGNAFTTTQGKTYAAEEMARMRQHFTESTQADQSTLAGIASVQNLITMGEQYKQTAFNDPSSLDTILGALDKGYRASVSMHTAMSAEEAARVTGEPLTQMKAAVAKSAIEGMIESGPNGIAEARRLLASGKYAEYIGDPTELLNRATATEERNNSMQRQQTELDEHTDRIQGEAAGSAIFNDISATIRAGGQPTPTQIKAASDWSNHDTGHGTTWGGLIPGRNDALQSLLDRSITDANSMRFQTSNPQVTEGFYNRALFDSSDPNALTQAEVDKAFTVDHTISSDDHQRLTEELRKRDKPNSDMMQATKLLDQNLMSTMRPFLTNAPALNADGTPNILGTGGHDPNGTAAWGEARRESREVLQAWVRSGKTPMEAVEIMTNPANNRNFIQRLQYFKQAVASGNSMAFFGHNPLPVTYNPALGAGQQQGAGGTGIAPGPDFHVTGGPGQMRRPGESPEAFLARTGGH
jgi:hypothetical protein